MSLKNKLYNHGSNCRVLKMPPDEADSVLEETYYPNSSAKKVMTPDEWDAFWEGYYNGDSTTVVDLSTL